MKHNDNNVHIYAKQFFSHYIPPPMRSLGDAFTYNKRGLKLRYLQVFSVHGCVTDVFTGSAFRLQHFSF